MILLFAGWGDPIPEKTAKGAEAYEKKQYEEALAHFLEAERARPELPVLPFNVGAALYQLDRHEDALDAYGIVSSAEDPELAVASIYGGGNCLFKMGKIEEAAEMYTFEIYEHPHPARPDGSYTNW